jgi:predicted hotdog family 3-hydroxylacyl-ACP dehydratase
MINHDEICQLIPHAGQMCLLDRVARWDEDFIVCESISHKLSNNPLRRSDSLPSVNLIEYGAQAMAVHGGLLARKEGRALGDGFLAALRDVHISNMDVSNISEKLTIEAECIMSQGGNLIYKFLVRTGDTCIVYGRATVIEVDGSNMRDKA